MRGTLAIGVVALAMISSMAAESAFGVTLYREDFPSDADGEPLASVGWNGENIGVDIGSGANSAGVALGGTDEFHWWFNNTTIALATPITELSYTTENPSIATTTPMLTFNWEQRLERQFDDNFGDVPGTGTGVDARIAVQVGGQWYASQMTFPTGNQTSATWDARSLVFNPAAANWRVVNNVDATPGVALGPLAGSALAGNITGVGFVATFAQQQTVNFNFLEVTGVPEPASGGLAACAAIALGAVRRRRSV